MDVRLSTIQLFEKCLIMEEITNSIQKIMQHFSNQEGLEELLLMSSHHDGFKRENAVLRLGMLGNPNAIPALLIRANDWVPQVRNAALIALEKLLTRNNAEAFVYSLPNLYRLKNCYRNNNNDLTNKVIDFLIQPENNQFLKQAISNENPFIARIALKLCIENELLSKYEIVTKALAHQDVLVRDISANLLRELKGNELELSLKKSIKDPFMPIRREAFQIYLRLLPRQGIEIAKTFLFDRHPALRELAVKNLLQQNFDVENVLLNVFEKENQSALKICSAIFGLSEIKAKALIPMLPNLANNPLPSIRKASLQAFAKLSTEQEVTLYLIAGINDESPAVAKESARLLNKNKIRFTLDELTRIIDSASQRHTLTICLGLSKNMNKWDRLIYLLTGLTKNEFDLDVFESEIVLWNNHFNMSWSQPTIAQKEQLALVYQKNREFLSARLKRSLDFTLENFRML